MEYCRYHPLKEAEFYCSYCQAETCSKCSVEPSSFRNNHDYHCFVCDSVLTEIEPEKNIQPFWRKIPEIHKYPLNSSGIAAIICTALAQMIALRYGSFLAMILNLAILLYCFTALSETARGDMEAPSFMNVFSDDIGAIFSLLGIYIVLGILLGAVFSFFGIGIGSLFMVAIIAAVPAIVMLLAIERSFLAALNASKIIRLMSTCGISYFVMLMFVILLSGSMSAVSSLYIGDSFSFWVFFSSAIFNYYLIVTFHVMGYMVYQNSNALDFDTKESSREVVTARTDQKMAEMEVEILLKTGRYKKATERYAHLLKSNLDHVFYWKRYAQLITETRNVSAIEKFADRYFEFLIEKEERMELSLTYQKFIKIVPTLNLKKTETIFAVANALSEVNKHSLVVLLLQKLNFKSESDGLEKQRLSMLATAYQYLKKKSS